jgi:hypothetical protein
MAAANAEGLTITDNQGRSPVHIAIQSGHVDEALILIEANPNTLKVRDSPGELPLHLHVSEASVILSTTSWIGMFMGYLYPMPMAVCPFKHSYFMLFVIGTVLSMYRLLVACTMPIKDR